MFIRPVQLSQSERRNATVDNDEPAVPWRYGGGLRSGGRSMRRCGMGGGVGEADEGWGVGRRTGREAG